MRSYWALQATMPPARKDSNQWNSSTGKRISSTAVGGDADCGLSSDDELSWQKPHRTSRPLNPPKSISVPLHNSFAQLEEEVHPEVPEGNSELTAGGQTKRRTTSRTTQKVGLQKDDVVVGSLWKPYSSSFFLPGKVMGRPVQFLIDTGCTSNLLSRHVFDRLPTEMKNRLQERTDHGMMADGSPLEFYGLLTLPVRIRSVQVTASHYSNSMPITRGCNPGYALSDGPTLK